MGLYCDVIRLSDADLKQCLQLSSDAEKVALIQQAADWFDIDKAWHGIHFLLSLLASTESSPLHFLLQEGTPLTRRNWDDIYGVAVPDMRAFDSAQVKTIAAALLPITRRDLRRCYNPDLLVQYQIYPMIWEQKSSLLNWLLAKYLKGSPHLDYLLFHFEKLKAYVQSSADQDAALAVKYHQ